METRPAPGKVGQRVHDFGCALGHGHRPNEQIDTTRCAHNVDSDAPKNLKGAAHYRRSVRNVGLRGMTDKAPRRPVTLPRILFLERPDPYSMVRPRQRIIEGTD
jgi:hypothetical protein